MAETLTLSKPLQLQPEATGISRTQEQDRSPQRFKSLRQMLARIAVTNQVMYFANSFPGFSPTGFVGDVKDIFASGQPGQMSKMDAEAIKSVPPQVQGPR